MAEVTMVSEVFAAAAQYPKNAAYEYLGFSRTFEAFEGDIRRCAAAFRAAGIGKGDRVTLSLPNVPQAVVIFYALNLIGAVACMTHPLSSAEEMTEYLQSAKPRAFVTMYQFYEKFRAAVEAVGVRFTLLTGGADALPFPLATAIGLREKKPQRSEKVLRYREFMKTGAKQENASVGAVSVENTTAVSAENTSAATANAGARVSSPEETQDVGAAKANTNARVSSIEETQNTSAATAAVVLYSGGTSGKTKGILLSNASFNAQARLTAEGAACVEPGGKMLAVMPIFHGFGLGVCIHMSLISGATCLLVPRFTTKTYAQLLDKRRPNIIVGVPTLYEALLRLPDTEKLDLSQLRGAFSGGDSLPKSLKKRVDEFLRERGAQIEIREGYGLTECVTACCLTPTGEYREGSIGLPFTGITFKIVTPETLIEAATGEVGEICISGPTLMLGYDNDPEETASTLKTHGDGRVWLHTGDLGEMDAEGYVYFRGRSKRMIVSAGYNVYPHNIERVIDAHEYVYRACVVGVADDYRMQSVKAFVVLNDDAPDGETALAAIREHCKKALAPYNQPREFELRDSLPMTLVGKVAYTQLASGDEQERPSALSME